MLYILSATFKTLDRLKFIAMNNKMSSYILIGFLFLAFSCKSESKKKLPSSDKTSVDVNTVKDLESEYQVETKEVNTTDPESNNKIEAEKDKPNEVQMPKKEKPATYAKAKPKKANVDKGIEIEMGYDVEKPKVEAEKPAKKEIVVESKPEKEIETEKPSKPERIEKFVGFPNHSMLDGLLKKHVSASGSVNYNGLKEDEATLDRYLAMLEATPPGTTWNRNQELAYWINAYNAYTIKLILKNYPLKSITNLNGGKPWDVKWINLDGKSLSLNNIENDIIRPKYKEPRIHFAVNCAAKSCPPLLNGAYKAKTLDAQLESQTKKFINNPAFNKLDKNAIIVSKIFDWYGEDFGDIASFIMVYADKTVKPSAKVTYMEYDWNLNL